VRWLRGKAQYRLVDGALLVTFGQTEAAANVEQDGFTHLRQQPMLKPSDRGTFVYNNIRALM